MLGVGVACSKARLIEAEKDNKLLQEELQRCKDSIVAMEDRLRQEREAKREPESECAHCNRRFFTHDLFAHQASCDWIETECRCCGLPVRKARLSAHIERCHTCTRCKAVLGTTSVMDHLLSDCPEIFKFCAICGERVHYAAETTHREECLANSARQALLHTEPVLGVVLLETASALGIEVDKVRPGSAAAAAGLRRGDRIVEVDGKPSSTHADFNRVLENAFPGEENVFLVQRGKALLPVRVRYGASTMSLEDVQELRQMAGADWCAIMDAKAVHERQAHVRVVALKEGHVERVLQHSPMRRPLSRA